MTLTDFLLARIAEDEAATERFLDDYVPDGAWGLTRVLAECDAKRQLIEQHENLMRIHRADNGVEINRTALNALYWAMMYLALPFADHPDYRPEWRP